MPLPVAVLLSLPCPCCCSVQRASGTDPKTCRDFAACHLPPSAAAQHPEMLWSRIGFAEPGYRGQLVPCTQWTAHGSDAEELAPAPWHGLVLAAEQGVRDASPKHPGAVAFLALAVGQLYLSAGQPPRQALCSSWVRTLRSGSGPRVRSPLRNGTRLYIGGMTTPAGMFSPDVGSGVSEAPAQGFLLPRESQARHYCWKHTPRTGAKKFHSMLSAAPSKASSLGSWSYLRRTARQRQTLFYPNTHFCPSIQTPSPNQQACVLVGSSYARQPLWLYYLVPDKMYAQNTDRFPIISSKYNQKG